MSESVTQRQKILVITNDRELISSARKLPKELPVDVSVQRGSYEALQVLRLTPTNLVLLDYDMPLIAGEELIRLVYKANSDTPIISVINPDQVSKKKDIIEAGAVDFMQRPVVYDNLKSVVFDLMFTKSYHFQVAALRDKLKKEYGLENIIGDCESMWKVFRAMGNISTSDVTVFVHGESGTGKEVLARAIHRNSPRSTRPMITINCAAIPENLLESELFGHEKGAFSGAVNRRIGKFELADTGTIFLDEIGEMSLVLQSKILRLLEEQQFERVGGNKTIKVNVRIISATNKLLEHEVKEGRFREDLYYRIKVYPIYLPPLRERVEDITLLVYHFLDFLSRKNNKEVVSISPESLELLKSYSWPGNIRELENVLERAILNCPGKVLNVRDFDIEESLNDNGSLIEVSDAAIPVSTPADSLNIAPVIPLKDVEKQAIVNALKVNNGNISKSARELGIGRATLHRKLKDHDIKNFDNR